MSIADRIFIENCRDIISNGVWDTDRPVRPRWEDGSPAHTVKLFGVVNRYDLSKEFPAITLRKTARSIFSGASSAAIAASSRSAARCRRPVTRVASAR